MLVTDLSLPGEAEWVLEHCLPEVIIHCAAMANMDECEKDPARAMKVNADLPGDWRGWLLKREQIRAYLHRCSF